jgi:transposase-like protein
MPERRKYDAEFREGAVTIVRETGRPIAEVARDLGIGAGTLGSWVKKDRLARGGGVRWRVEVVDYATDYATALAGFDVNGSGDFDSAAEIESAIEADAITTSDGPSFVCPVIPLPN